MQGKLRSPSRYQEFTATSIDELVESFYAKVRDNASLSPVFDRVIKDWPPHLARMKSFWTTVLQNRAAYTQHPQGSPPQLHQAIEELELAHFDEWLSLWDEVSNELFVAERASILQLRARQMARALTRHLSN